MYFKIINQKDSNVFLFFSFPLSFQIHATGSKCDAICITSASDKKTLQGIVLFAFYIGKYQHITCSLNHNLALSFSTPPLMSHEILNNQVPLPQLLLEKCTFNNNGEAIIKHRKSRQMLT
jgi:hypothetical protein